MRKRLYRQGLAGLMAVFLAGCALGPDYQEPEFDLPEELPDHVLLSEAEREEWEDWWTRFDDPTLNSLVNRAMDQNLDIRLRTQQIQEARARLGLAEANRLPSLDAQAEATRESASERATLQPVSDDPQNLYSLSGQLGYEIDLWGRLARSEEAAEAILSESVFSHDAIQLATITDVVTTYTNLRAAQREVAILERTIESREETLELEELRFESGETDALTLRQAESELATTRARLPAARERVRTLQSALAVLVGMSPRELMTELKFGPGELTDLDLPSNIPRVLPSDLLNRRPDLRASEAALMASTAEIGVAQAERLPQLNLSSFLGSTSIEFADLLTAPATTWGLGASVVGPIIDFGRGAARVDTAEALRDQAETRYRMTVLTAFREVRDALAIYETSAQRVESVRRQVEAVEDTARLARLRYDEGFVGFIEVLDAERNLLEAELALADAMRTRLNATASLFKALGGGWEEDLSPLAASGEAD
ncbi:efflux transporter outer membrane subunit [Fodinicurvata halophila]|uniref:Efflux transporter outer membrane subunit n=2 Tax=Fodinicurvata halophila TaxID=1419723 RepID=A0ABV8UN32_9PROT